MVASAGWFGDISDGAENFNKPIPKGNGRACATCHIPSKSFTITPAEVQAQFQQNPNGPLFRSIDADDFVNNYNTVLNKALFRVTIRLPSNVKLADDPSATEVKIFRAVPSIFNVKQTAPFTFDGRELTLFSQAKAAALEHSRPTGNQLPSNSFFSKIVAFEESKFSSPIAKYASDRIQYGQAPPPVGQDYDGGALSALEQQGFDSFRTHCANCHDGSFRDTMTDPRFPGGFTSIGISELNRSGLAVHAYNVTENGVTRVVPPTPDPGRLLITGKFADANLFDPTQLRGIKNTAPYFHDNSSATLEDVLAHYNVLFSLTGTPLIPTSDFPALVAYLNRL